MFIHYPLLVLYQPLQMSHPAIAQDATGRAYGSLTLLFSRIDSFHPFSYCSPIILPQNGPASQLASATRDLRARPSMDSCQSSKNAQLFTTPRTPSLPRLASISVLPLSPTSNSCADYPSRRAPYFGRCHPYLQSTTHGITGTRGRRTAASGRGGNMKVGEVKGLMYENVSLIDIRTGVVHYPGAGHTSVMTVGVRIGSCVEKMDVIELLEMMDIVEREVERVEGEDAWRPDIPIPQQPKPHIPSTPVAPLHPQFFDRYHIQNGCAYTAYRAYPSTRAHQVHPFRSSTYTRAV